MEILTAKQRDEQRRAADELLPRLRAAHEARASDEFMSAIAELEPVPSLWHTIPVDSSERKLGVMVLAYAKLVTELYRQLP